MTGRFMPRAIAQPLEPVIRRMRAFAHLSPADEEVLRQLGDQRTRHAPEEELIAEGAPVRRARFLISGWAISQRVLTNGRRQVFGVTIPGDGIGVQPRLSAPALCSVIAASTVETVDAEPILDIIREGRSPGLTRALAAAARLDDILSLDHMTRLGSQTAYERVAHFLLEMQHRLELADLGDERRFPLPLTQELLADTLGLSMVHINRTLQQLRRDKLIELRSGVCVLLEREALIRLADFRWPDFVARPRVSNPAVGGRLGVG